MFDQTVVVSLCIVMPEISLVNLFYRVIDLVKDNPNLQV